MTAYWILHYPIQYIKNCWVRLLLNYNIKYICTIYTRLDTCIMSISRFSCRDKVTLRLLQLYFEIADVIEWSRALEIRLSDWCCSVPKGMSSNPVEGRTKIWQLEDLILTLFGLIFRRIEIDYVRYIFAARKPQCKIHNFITVTVWQGMISFGYAITCTCIYGINALIMSRHLY